MTSKHSGILAILFLFIPALSGAALFELTLTGSVDSVDSPLDTSFAAGDAFELKVQFDPDTGWDMWGSNATWDGTRFNAYNKNGVYQNSFTIGTSYAAENSPVGPNFIDMWDQGTQRVDMGSNNFQGDNVAGLELRQIYFDNVFNGTPLPGASDPDDILSGNDFMGVNGATFAPGQGNTVSFALPSSSDTKKVRFSLSSASVVDVTPVTHPIAYYDQTGIADINGNGHPEFASLRTVRSGTLHVLIQDAVSRQVIKTMFFLSPSFSPISVSALPDTNGNGSDELAVMALEKATGRTRTMIKDSLTGENINVFNYRP